MSMEAGVSILSTRRWGRGARTVLVASAAASLLLALIASSDYSQADSAPQAPRPAQPAASDAPAAVPGTIDSSRSEQLASKLAELDAIVLEKQKLEGALRAQKSELAAIQLQLANTKKLIQAEVDDFLGQGIERKRRGPALEFLFHQMFPGRKRLMVLNQPFERQSEECVVKEDRLG